MAAFSLSGHPPLPDEVAFNRTPILMSKTPQSRKSSRHNNFFCWPSLLEWKLASGFHAGKCFCCDAFLVIDFNAQAHGGEYALLQPPKIRFN